MLKLRDEQWERIREHFPEENVPDGRPGRKPIPTCRVLEAVLWILNTGAQWHMLPQGYPNYKAVHRRFQQPHVPIDEIHEARQLGELAKYRQQLGAASLLVIDDLFLRRLPPGAGDELADVLMSRYEKFANRRHLESARRGLAGVLGDVVVVAPLLDRLIHHGHLLKFEGRSWRLNEAAARVTS